MVLWRPAGTPRRLEDWGRRAVSPAPPPSAIMKPTTCRHRLSERGTQTVLPEVRAAGDSAVLVVVGEHLDRQVNRQVHQLAAHLRDLGLDAVIPGYVSLLVQYDPARYDFEEVRRIILSRPASAAEGPKVARRWLIPVRYGGDFGPDLDDVAAYHHISPDDVVMLHAHRDYTIYCLGFSPGFPMLGELPPDLHTPRLDTPRTRVPAGSVAIGGRQTGIYPSATPGGWRLIGRTPVPLFDPAARPPVPYQPGDCLRFEPIDEALYTKLADDAAHGRYQWVSQPIEGEAT